MKTYQYLIVAEIGRIGFITEFKNTYKEAEIFSKELLELAQGFLIEEFDEAVNILKQRNYRSYTIKGNALYFGKAKYQVSNGEFTISIVQIELKTFSLPALIKERENSSFILGYEDFEFFDKYPEPNWICN